MTLKHNPATLHAEKKCFGKCYICCNEICEIEEQCRLKYQEEIASPRLENEMTKHEILGKQQ